VGAVLKGALGFPAVRKRGIAGPCSRANIETIRNVFGVAKYRDIGLFFSKIVREDERKTTVGA